MNSSVLEGGFSSGPQQSAEAFRKIMNVLAKPGMIEHLAIAQPPAPLSPATGTLLLTLCDSQTPIYLSGRFDCADVRDWITFHCNSPMTDVQNCRFAIGDWEALKPLDAYPIGISEYPDRSATLIVEMDDLSQDIHQLEGPGIKTTAHLSLPEEQAFQKNASLFPLGLDFYFTSGEKIAALPRTTKVSKMGETA